MIQVLMFFGGLALLVAGADLLVRGASRLAISLGISPLVVGLTVVAFGTSAPEIAVSTSAVLSGTAELALGNAIGSNIFNVLFVLGLSALVKPLVVQRQIVRQDVPFMLASAALLALLCLDGSIGVYDSALLCSLLLLYTAFVVRQSRRHSALVAPERDAAGGWLASRWTQALAVGVGLMLLVAGSDAMVGAAVYFARAFGVSDVVIGLTVVAAGTSLPELATSIRAVHKGQTDMAVGNVVGSCLFNILGVVGVAGLAAATTAAGALSVPPSVLHFDLWVMLAALFACLPVFITGRRIARWEGGLLLAYYVAYTTYLVLQSKQHEALPAFSFVMLAFVLPLTALTLVVAIWNRPLRRLAR